MSSLTGGQVAAACERSMQPRDCMLRPRARLDLRVAWASLLASSDKLSPTLRVLWGYSGGTLGVLWAQCADDEPAAYCGRPARPAGRFGQNRKWANPRQYSRLAIVRGTFKKAGDSEPWLVI